MRSDLPKIGRRPRAERVDRDPYRVRRDRVVAAALMAGAAAIAWLTISAIIRPHAPPGGAPAYVDADCYMRLERVREIVEGGQYPFTRFTRSNPPEGETSHWGLPLDILLIAGAGLATPLSGSFAAALQDWSTWLGPALFAVFVLVLMSCSTRFAGPLASGALFMLLLGSQAVLHPFLPLRPDHHGLLLLLHASSFALLARAMRAPRDGGGRALLWSAALGAVAVWVSVESCVLIALIGGWLALRVPWPGQTHRSLRLRMLFRWTSALWLGLLAAWVIERGGIAGPLAWATDTLSARHLLAGAVALCSLLLCRRPLASGTRAAILRSLGAAGMATAMAWVLADRIGPAPAGASIDPRIVFEFFGKASSDAMPLFNDTHPPLRNLLLWYGFPIAALPLAVLSGLRVGGPAGDIARLTSICAIAYAALGLVMMRWCSYAMLFATPVVACWLAHLGHRAASACSRKHAQSKSARAEALRPRTKDRGTMIEWCAALALALPIGLGGRIVASHLPVGPGESGARHEVDDAAFRARAVWERDRRALGIESRKVLTHAATGPMVMYTWGASVAATPNVRNAGGISKLFRWLLSTDPDTSLREMRKDGWPYALIVSDPFPPEIDAYRHFAGIGNGMDGTLLDALDHCPPSALVGQWPLGPTGTRLKLIRLPASEAELGEWSATRGREP